MEQQLAEKYRPKILDDIRGNEDVVRCLKTLTVEDLPNMLFYGPPGTGKTTAIRAVLRDHPVHCVLELNASDERGISTVRNSIKEFASTRSEEMRVVVLDEADNMSKDAQSALRRIMEDYPRTRFCLICNYARKIIDPIASRCTRFRFAPVNDASRIEEICLKEGMAYDEEGIATIRRFSDGDMRKAINDIQGMRGGFDAITRKNVLEFFGLLGEEVYQRIFEALACGDFKECAQMVKESDVDCVGLLTNLTKILLDSKIKRKYEICRILADIEQRLGKGCTEGVQMNAIVAAFISNRG